MDLIVAKKLAVDLMTKHNLIQNGWSFSYDNAKRRFGVCKYRTKTIGLSTHLVSLNDEINVKDTILHEIAHALVGHGHGHNHVWQRKAIEIGCNGKRCYDSKLIKTPEAKYEAVCHGCNHVHKRHKAPRMKSSCGKCSGGRYNEKYLLIYKTKEQRNFQKYLVVKN
jgi:hypothetical protein